MFVVTVGRLGSRMATFRSGGRRISHPIWTGKIYEARQRQDGVLTWRFVRYLPNCPDVSGTTPSAKFMAAVEALARTMNLNFQAGIRHGARVQSVQSE